MFTQSAMYSLSLKLQLGNHERKTFLGRRKKHSRFDRARSYIHTYLAHSVFLRVEQQVLLVHIHCPHFSPSNFDISIQSSNRTSQHEVFFF